MQLPHLIAYLSLSAALATAAPHPAAATKCTTNTFKNGYFDSYTLTPWAYSNYSCSGCTATLHHPGSGTSNGAVSLNAYNNGGPGPAGQTVLYQTIDLCPNTAYTVSFLYAAAATAPHTFFEVSIEDSTGNAHRIFISSGTISTNYTQGSGTFTTGSTATNELFFLTFDNPDKTLSSLYVDAISVVAG